MLEASWLALQTCIKRLLPTAAVALGDEHFGDWAVLWLDGARGGVSASAAAAVLQMHPVPYALDNVTAAYTLARSAEALAGAREMLASSDLPYVRWENVCRVVQEQVTRSVYSLGKVFAKSEAWPTTLSR